MIVMLPVTQMAWSLWETVVEVAAVGRPSGQPPLEGHAAWIVVVRALLHGLAILIVLAVVLRIASRASNELPRRVKLEPTVAPPRK